MRIYYFFGRLVSPVVLGLFCLYSFVTRTSRARVIVKNENDEILLLQTWPDTDIWSLPGGGIGRSERPEVAAVRELREETGIIVPTGAMRPRFTFRSRWHEELVYSTSVQKSSLPSEPPNKWEVRQAAWFALDSLPRVTPGVRHIVTEVAIQG